MGSNFLRWSFLLLCLPFLMLCPLSLQASDRPAASPTNFGLAGLWEYPTAEMPEDGEGRFGYTHASPYAFGYVDLTWLPWLEVNVRLSTFDNIWVDPLGKFNDDGFGRHYMDKAMDLKAMLYRSPGWPIPSLALGVTDVMGTELMKAWYGVATWRWGAFALSLGYGTDRMNGLFGGIAWNVADWLTLKAEYSPMDYSGDAVERFKPHPGQPSSKYNVGMVLRAPWGTEGSFSRQRGEEYVFSLSQRFDLSGPYLFGGRSSRPPIEASGEGRISEWEDVRPAELSRRIEEGLERYVRVRDVEIEVGDRKVLVAYENYGHSSHAEAMVRVLVVVAAVSPHLDSLTLLSRLEGVPVVCAEFPGELLFDIRARSLRDDDPLRSSVFTWAHKLRGFASPRGSETEGGVAERISKGAEAYRSGRLLRERTRHRFKAMLVYEPRLDQTLDDDYQHRWSLDLIYRGHYSDGWGAFADIRVPIVNDVDIWWEPDMNDKIRLHRAVVSRLANWGRGASSGLWLLGEAGWLDENWFGLNLWGRRYSRDGRWWIGARAAVFRDRDPVAFAGLARGQIDYGYGGYDDMELSPWRTAGWVQAGYSFEDMGLDLQADYGRFADSDVGAKLSATRRWDDTAVGFWVSRTDRLTPGKDFTHAGIHLELPAERWLGSWFGRSSDHVWVQDVPFLSTWRIDAGREGGHWRTPEQRLGQLRPMALKKNVGILLMDYCSFEAPSRSEPEVRSLADYFPALRHKAR